jgi:hypothetical protein
VPGHCFVASINFECFTRNYIKASKEKVDKTVSFFQQDPQKMELLSILDEQVGLLVNEGRPDLSRFFHSLDSHSIIPSEEVSGLRMEYGLETVSRFLVWDLQSYTNIITGTLNTRLLRDCHHERYEQDRSSARKGRPQ